MRKILLGLLTTCLFYVTPVSVGASPISEETMIYIDGEATTLTLLKFTPDTEEDETQTQWLLSLYDLGAYLVGTPAEFHLSVFSIPLNEDEEIIVDVTGRTDVEVISNVLITTGFDFEEDVPLIPFLQEDMMMTLSHSLGIDNNVSLGFLERLHNLNGRPFIDISTLVLNQSRLGLTITPQTDDEDDAMTLHISTAQAEVTADVFDGLVDFVSELGTTVFSVMEMEFYPTDFAIVQLDEMTTHPSVLVRYELNAFVFMHVLFAYDEVAGQYDVVQLQIEDTQTAGLVGMGADIMLVSLNDADDEADMTTVAVWQIFDVLNNLVLYFDVTGEVVSSNSNVAPLIGFVNLATGESTLPDDLFELLVSEGDTLDLFGDSGFIVAPSLTALKREIMRTF